MVAKVILNPYAGRWKALERRAEAEAALKEAGVDFEITLTEHPGDGIVKAAQAVLDGYSPIIAAGGDGSINEVVNGIAAGAKKAGTGDWTPLGILPLGSANDLVVNLGLPTELKSAANVIRDGNLRMLDIGSVRVGPGNPRYFDNNSAIGLEPTITLIQQRIKRLRGVLRYLVATLIGIGKNPQWEMSLEWDNGSYQGPATLVTVGNNPLTGGLFYMTPHADPFDGKLTFVYGSMPTRIQILRLLPRTMKPGPGSYIEHTDIHEVHATWLKIRTNKPTPLHADGEIQAESTQEIEYQILASKLPLYLPASADT